MLAIRIPQRLQPLRRHIRTPHRIDRLIQSRTLLTQSKVAGPLEPPLLYDTCHGYLSKIVSKHGDKTAVVSSHQSTRLTYRDLDIASTRLAHGLASLGVKQGSRVTASLGNTAEFAILHYAVFKLGAILVPLNPAFTGSQLKSALNHLESEHLVISAETNLPFKPPRSNLELLEEVVPRFEGRGIMGAVGWKVKKCLPFGM